MSLESSLYANLLFDISLHSLPKLLDYEHVYMYIYTYMDRILMQVIVEASYLYPI